MNFAELSELLRPLLEAGQRYGDALVPAGLILLSLSLVLTLASAIYMWWLGEKEGAMAKFGRGFILFLIPLALLQNGNWTTATGHLAQFFQVELTTPLLERGGAQTGGSGSELVKGLITKISNSIWADAPNNAADGKSTWDRTLEFLKNPAASMGDIIFGGLTDFLLRGLLTIVGMGLILAMLFALYSPLIMLQLGVIFGPILICWLPFRPMENLARQWFRFMLTSGMSLLVGVMLVLICAGSIDVFVSSISSVQSADLPWFMQIVAKFSAFIAAATAMLFMAAMMFRADNIAAALIGGMTEGGSVGAVVINTIQKAADAGGAQLTKAPPK